MDGLGRVRWRKAGSEVTRGLRVTDTDGSTDRGEERPGVPVRPRRPGGWHPVLSEHKERG